MDLREYFNDHNGIAVLSTANKLGEVNSAIYSRPHVLSDEQIGFVMTGKRSFANLKENPQAAYLFIEEGTGYKGLRFQLEVSQILDDQEVVRSYRQRRKDYYNDNLTLYFVLFNILESRELIGDKVPDVIL